MLSVWNLVEGSLNALPGLSLFTLVSICIFPAWPIGVCSFCLSFSVFSLSWTVFDGRIGNLCKRCFVEADFALLGEVVHVRVVDSMCIVAWTNSLDLFLFLTC